MKKLLIAGLCLVSSLSFGAELCNNGAAQQGNLTAGNPTDFVKNSFPIKCSANVFLHALQSNIAFAATSGSSKGKTVFGATSAGGAVTKVGNCTVTGCVTGDVSAQTQAQLNSAT